MPSDEAEPTTKFIPTQAPAVVSDFSASAIGPHEPRSSEWPMATVATFLYARLHSFAPACQVMSASALTAFVNDVRHMGPADVTPRANGAQGMFRSQCSTPTPATTAHDLLAKAYA